MVSNSRTSWTSCRVKAPGVHPQAVLDQVDDCDQLAEAGGAGVALLDGDDVFDVLDVFAELLQFLEDGTAARSPSVGELAEEAGKFASDGILGNVGGGRPALLIEQRPRLFRGWGCWSSAHGWPTTGRRHSRY